MNNTGYLIMQLAKQMRYQLNQRLLAQGLTVQQWAVMQQMSLWQERTETVPTANQLCQQLDMDKPTMSGIVRRLTAKQFIEQHPNPDDQRAKLLQLTSEGTVALHAGQQVSDEVLALSLQALTASEQHMLQQLLRKLEGETVK